MKKFDRRKLALGILSGVLTLLWLLKDSYSEAILFVCIIGVMWSYGRWMTGFLSKNPDAGWRRFPWFLENEPVLNVFCLNFYKWFGVMLLFMIIQIIRSANDWANL